MKNYNNINDSDTASYDESNGHLNVWDKLTSKYNKFYTPRKQLVVAIASLALSVVCSATGVTDALDAKLQEANQPTSSELDAAKDISEVYEQKRRRNLEEMKHLAKQNNMPQLALADFVAETSDGSRLFEISGEHTESGESEFIFLRAEDLEDKPPVDNDGPVVDV